MRRAPAALTTVLLLSGLRTAGAEPCPPRVALAGDGEAIARVGEELGRLGVSIATADAAPPRDGCPTLRAQVGLEPNGKIAVAVQGATSGSEGRVVSDAALAAAWIDSWTREDVDVALWAAPPSRVASVQAEPTGTPRDGAPHDVVPAAPPTTPGESRWEQFSIAAGYEQAWSDDDASWSGASASACVRVAGGFCVGGRARMAFDPERLYNVTGVARSDLSLLATASYPVAVGTMSIAPELGLGIGRLATRRAEGECKPVMPPNCDPMDPMCIPEPPTCEPTNPGDTMTTPKLFVGDNFSAVTYAPRLPFALRIAVPLFEHVWLDGLAGMTYSPFAHGADFKTTTDPAIQDVIALPGEPSSGYVLGIGLRVGAR